MSLTNDQLEAIRNETMVDPRFAMTAYVVQATSYEQLCLWKDWHRHVSWVQDNPGWGKNVGYVGGLPCVISVSWIIINGCYVMFYTDESQVVDHRMIERWLKENCNPQAEGRRAHCDAMNFGHCMAVVAPLARRLEKA